jgi:hypothetical protein
MRCMVTMPKRGDVLIRPTAAGYELVDAITEHHLAAADTFHEALALAAKHRAAVWHANVSDDRRPVGEPVLVLPNVYE